MFDGYLADYPKGAKEATTLKTERIHVAHLRRLLDTKLPLVDVTARTIQGYADARAADVGTETVKKGVGTLAAVWNKWAVPQGMIGTPAPTAGMVYPKTESKPPFQTREQIERQLARRKTTPEEEAALWECLCLTPPKSRRCPKSCEDGSGSRTPNVLYGAANGGLVSVEYLKPEAKMTSLARTFPSVAAAPGVPRWDANTFNRWAADTAISHGELRASQFLLAVWDSQHAWQCGPFDLMESLRVWDAAHRAAFLGWVRDPWWP